MTRIFLSILLFGLLSACNDENSQNNQEQNQDALKELSHFNNDDEKVSYCIGLDNGNAILNVYSSEQTKGKFSLVDIEEGLVDYLGDEDLKISVHAIDSILNLYLGDEGQVDATHVSMQDASYAIGLVEAQTLVGSFVGRGIDQQMEIPQLIEGIRDGINNEPNKISLLKARQEVAAYYSEMNRIMGESFLSNNAKKATVQTTKSGLQFEQIMEGTGRQPNLTDTCIVHYTGRFIDGRVFESTVPSQQPAQFTLMNVIPGWQEGLQLMKEGGSARFYIPYQLAYGEKGSGPIEPFSTLVFDIELLRVLKFKPQK